MCIKNINIKEYKMPINPWTQTILQRFLRFNTQAQLIIICVVEEENLYYILFECFKGDLHKIFNIMFKEDEIAVNLVEHV